MMRAIMVIMGGYPMKAKKRRPIKWVILLVIVLALAAGALMRPADTALYTETQVKRGEISTTYSFTGSLAAERTQTVTAAAADRVKNLYVEANAKVKEGDKLLRLMSGEVVKAEIDGEVVSLNVEEDDPVMPGSALMVIMDVERMEAKIQIDEYDAEAIGLGKEVSVTVNALDETVPGTIRSFSKQAVSMGTMAAYTASVQMDVPEKALPGMQVEVKMLNQKAENALLLKVDALQFDEENQVYVLVKNAEDEYEAVYIETGINDGSTVQILSGLEEGQTVYYSAGIDMAALMQAMRGGMRR